MQKLHRMPLSSAAQKLLAKRTLLVQQAADPKEESERLWGLKKNRAFDEIRRKLKLMAPGKDHCMYCERNEAGDIDHFRPKSEYPADAFSWPNYLLACSHCNSNYKRDQFPTDAHGEALLLNPMEDNPADHLIYSPSTGRLKEKSGSIKGQKSIEVFGLNRMDTVRADAFYALQHLIIRYAQMKSEKEDRKADECRGVIRRHIFASLLIQLQHIHQNPQLSNYLVKARRLDAACLKVLDTHPEIASWLQVHHQAPNLLNPIIGNPVASVQSFYGDEWTLRFESTALWLYLGRVTITGISHLEQLQGHVVNKVELESEATQIIFGNGIQLTLPHTDMGAGACFLFENQNLIGTW